MNHVITSYILPRISWIKRQHLKLALGLLAIVLSMNNQAQELPAKATEWFSVAVGDGWIRQNHSALFENGALLVSGDALGKSEFYNPGESKPEVVSEAKWPESFLIKYDSTGKIEWKMTAQAVDSGNRLTYAVHVLALNQGQFVWIVQANAPYYLIDAIGERTVFSAAKSRDLLFFDSRGKLLSSKPLPIENEVMVSRGDNNALYLAGPALSPGATRHLVLEWKAEGNQLTVLHERFRSTDFLNDQGQYESDYCSSQKYEVKDLAFSQGQVWVLCQWSCYEGEGSSVDFKGKTFLLSKQVNRPESNWKNRFAVDFTNRQGRVQLLQHKGQPKVALIHHEPNMYSGGGEVKIGRAIILLLDTTGNQIAEARLNASQITPYARLISVDSGFYCQTSSWKDLRINSMPAIQFPHRKPWTLELLVLKLNDRLNYEWHVKGDGTSGSAPIELMQANTSHLWMISSTWNSDFTSLAPELYNQFPKDLKWKWRFYVRRIGLE